MKSLYEELLKYSESDFYPFHMPGHKRCSALAFHKSCSALAFHKSCSAMAFHKCDDALMPDTSLTALSDIYRLDITEIEGFDNLHHATGLLAELQKKAAAVYHAEESFFLINGSTGGILSAVSAVAQEGKKLLLARNCHKSVYHAVLLNRLRTEYLWPEIIEEFDIQGEIVPEQVEERIKENKNGSDICGIVITSPTYDGVISDIRGIAEAAHRYRIPLIVDEAHGAHFALSETAPESAVDCGADIVVNSVHKTLPAMTQTALLHIQGNLIDREKLKRYLSVYQSSSPSYILMASIDSCIDFISEQGRKCYDRLLAFRREIEESAEQFSHIRLFPGREKFENKFSDCVGASHMQAGLSGEPGRATYDPGKLVISVKNTGMTGRQLYETLLKKYHLQMEMAAPSYVLGILTGLDDEEGVRRLICALREIEEALKQSKEEKQGAGSKRSGAGLQDFYAKAAPPDICYSISEAMRQETEWVPIREAAGRISGEFVCLYPPGIPLVAPGERIGRELIENIMRAIGERSGLPALEERQATPGAADDDTVKAPDGGLAFTGLSGKNELRVLRKNRESVEIPGKSRNNLL